MVVPLKPEPPSAPIRYVRAPRPLHFPVAATVPESKRHLKLRTVLLQVLETFAHQLTVGSDQFVYWSASDPAKCLAPDAFVRLGAPDSDFDSWKTWERGAPELCVEIVSESDSSAAVWERKLAAYHELGVTELVRFDADAAAGKRLRVWDRLDGDLVERVVVDQRTPCATLGLAWVLVPVGDYPIGLRLARDAEGRELVPTLAEAEAGERHAAEDRAAAEARGREAAERRVAELEEELRRRGG